MAVKLGIVAFLEAKPGKADDLGAFLEGGRALAAAEEGTVTWYAFRVDEHTFGIFERCAIVSGVMQMPECHVL